MLLRMRRTLFGQAIFLLAVTVSGSFVFWYTRYLPLLRINFHLALLAIFAAAGVLLLSGALLLLGLRFPRTGLGMSLREKRNIIRNQDPSTRFGAAVAAGAGEEFILRGVIFGYLMDEHLVLAFVVTLAVSGIGYFRAKAEWYWTCLQVIEAACYAILFYEHRSVFLIGLARFIQEYVSTLALMSPWALYLLEQKRFSWRNLYGAFRASQSTVQRV